MRAALGGLLFLVVSSGCAPPNLSLPAGTSCAKTSTAGPDVASLRNALSGASRGTCVVAAPGRYRGELFVPAGVILGAEAGAAVELVGTQADVPAVTLGAGATLTGLRVLDAPGIGVLGGPGAQLLDVRVEGALGAGLVFWCEEDCRVGEPAGLSGVELIANAVGLLVHGARVTAVGGRVSGSKSLALASGYGVVASHGADLQLSGTLVEENEELGVLIDGAMDTNASLQEVTVKNNRGRGIWAQGLVGTLGSPRLRLGACVVEGNQLVGLGARGSHGVRVEGGKVSTTALGQTMGGPGVTVTVGDGIGLFEGSGDVQVDAVALDGNARSQVLVDQGAAGVTVQGSTVSIGSGQFGVVVQRTTEPVQAPMITTPMAGQELSISAPTLSLPTR